jgi:hypothetical protein
MLNRQFSLLVMIGLLLSADLVHANENVSVGNVQIRTTKNGTVLQTPKIQISTPKATGKALTSRTRRRSRTAVVRSKPQVVISKPSVILPQRVGTSAPPVIIINTPTSTPTTPSSTVSSPTSHPTVPNSTVSLPTGTSRVRRSTIRTSTNGSESVSTQQQSIQCNSDDEGSSSVTQSTSTVNGRTVRSETRTNCR